MDARLRGHDETMWGSLGNTRFGEGLEFSVPSVISVVNPFPRFRIAADGRFTAVIGSVIVPAWPRRPATIGELAARPSSEGRGDLPRLRNDRFWGLAMTAVFTAPERAASDRAPRPVPATACFSVHAGADPGVMPRVLEQFAKRGLVPSSWTSRTGGDELDIDIQMQGMERALAELVAACLRNVVGVRMVLTSERYCAE